MNLITSKTGKYRDFARRMGLFLNDIAKQKGQFVERADESIELKKGFDGVYTHDNADGDS